MSHWFIFTCKGIYRALLSEMSCINSHSDGADQHTRTSFGSVSCPRTPLHEDQVNWTSNPPITRCWLNPWATFTQWWTSLFHTEQEATSHQVNASGRLWISCRLLIYCAGLKAVWFKSAVLSQYQGSAVWRLRFTEPSHCWSVWCQLTVWPPLTDASTNSRGQKQ